MEPRELTGHDLVMARLFGRDAPTRLRQMQAECDSYGKKSFVFQKEKGKFNGKSEQILRSAHLDTA